MTELQLKVKKGSSLAKRVRYKGGPEGIDHLVRQDWRCAAKGVGLGRDPDGGKKKRSSQKERGECERWKREKWGLGVARSSVIVRGGTTKLGSKLRKKGVQTSEEQKGDGKQEGHSPFRKQSGGRRRVAKGKDAICKPDLTATSAGTRGKRGQKISKGGGRSRE